MRAIKKRKIKHENETEIDQAGGTKATEKLRRRESARGRTEKRARGASHMSLAYIYYARNAALDREYLMQHYESNASRRIDTGFAAICQGNISRDYLLVVDRSSKFSGPQTRISREALFTLSSMLTSDRS